MYSGTDRMLPTTGIAENIWTHIIYFNIILRQSLSMSDLETIRRDLAEQLQKSFKTGQIKDIIRAHGDEDHLLPPRAGLDDLIAEHIRCAYDQETQIEILESYLETAYPGNEEQYDHIFSKTKYDVQYVGEDVKILEKGRAESNELNQDHKWYIEEEANPETIESIERAESQFAKGNYGDACTQLRHALESMTAEDYSYHEGLDELSSKGIIQQDNKNTRDHDALYLSYGYNSDIGSHKHLGKHRSYQQQAEFSMVVVIETIYFLLQIIDEAKDNGIMLEKWDV